MNPDAELSLSQYSEEAQALSAAMQAHLLTQIKENAGFLPFQAFMHEVLYTPGLGYYVNGQQTFGPGGDFTTAPELSAVFGRVIARQVAQLHSAIDADQLVEFGAGSGVLAESILRWFQEVGRPCRYAIVEVSPSLVAAQRARLAEFVGHSEQSVVWVDDPARLDCRGAIIANEVMDALPVVRFEKRDGQFLERGVSEDAGRLVAASQPVSASLTSALARLEEKRGKPFPEGYVSEVCLPLDDWIAQLSGCLREGVILLSDYGYSRADFYSDERSAGTLMCHARQRAHGDYLFAPGLQDLTAWVDFTAVAEAALKSDLSVMGYTTQSNFLLAGGLTEEVGSLHLSEEAMLRESAAIKSLTLPGEMGERFRFIALERGNIPVMNGFTLKDLLYTL
ncbi:MAG: SAM-dependent methyltransferase [Pseudomonadota bacterium]